jgi:hypothetical protein
MEFGLGYAELWPARRFRRNHGESICQALAERFGVATVLSVRHRAGLGYCPRA